MPGWRIHNKWAVKMGISADVATWVNRLLDFPDSMLPLSAVLQLRSACELQNVRSIHTLIHTKRWAFEMCVELARERYGLQGVHAVYLHRVLDYVAELLDSVRVARIKQLTSASRKYRGLPRLIRKRLISGYMKSKSVNPSSLNTGAIRELLNKWCAKWEVPMDVVIFVNEHLNEIIKDIVKEKAYKISH